MAARPERPARGPMRESFRVLGVYVRGQVLLCLILAVLYTGAFALDRVPYWYVWGPIGGVSALIPHVGGLFPIAGAVLCLVLAKAPLDRSLIALGIWLLIQLLEYLVLVPRLISRPLGLKELPVLVAVLLASLFFGPIGLVFAVPALAIGMVFWRHFHPVNK